MIIEKTKAEIKHETQLFGKPLLSVVSLLDEIWVSVIGYDGYYEISNKGRVKSLARDFFTAKNIPCKTKEKIKSSRLSNLKSGRTNVFVDYSLNGQNKRYNLSKQVAIHFIKEYKGEPLYFIDGDRDNCSLENIIVVNRENVYSLYNNNINVPPNEVSEILFELGLKKCSVCKEIKKHNLFPKSNRNRNINNNCQRCINQLTYAWRNDR